MICKAILLDNQTPKLNAWFDLLAGRQKSSLQWEGSYWVSRQEWMMRFCGGGNRQIIWILQWASLCTTIYIPIHEAMIAHHLLRWYYRYSASKIRRVWIYRPIRHWFSLNILLWYGDHTHTQTHTHVKSIVTSRRLVETSFVTFVVKVRGKPTCPR